MPRDVPRHDFTKLDRYGDSPTPQDTKINLITKLRCTIKRSLSRSNSADFRVLWCRRVTISVQLDEIVSRNISRHQESVGMVLISSNLLKSENNEMLMKLHPSKGKLHHLRSDNDI